MFLDAEYHGNFRKQISLPSKQRYDALGYCNLEESLLKRYIFVTSLIVALAGCAGEMTGQIRGTGERVKFTYEQGIDSDTYSAVIGDEMFSGKAVMDGSTSVIATGLGTAFDAGLFGSTTTNRFVAILLGNKGSSLNCQMRYADSSGFTTSGGVGVCQHSDGRMIDIVW